MNVNGAVTRADVARALGEQIEQLSEDVRAAFGIRFDPGEISEEGGAWIIPVDVSDSLESQKSYELHRLLSDLQRAVEHRLGVFASIILAH